MSSILVSCRNKSAAETHYLPALRAAGWVGGFHFLTPGDALPGLAEVGGLLLTGGDDIHPRHWDPAEAVHGEARVDADRDALEIPLVRAAWERGLPVLGICRGEQILNVALGGSLVQDVPDHFGCDPSRHRHGTADTPDLRHRVQLAPGSRLRALLGEDVFLVNSRHHQAVKAIAPPLRAAGWHLDTVHPGTGPLVEAIEAQDEHRWAFGVQWHPENLTSLKGPAGETARAIFSAFAARIRTT